MRGLRFGEEDDINPRLNPTVSASHNDGGEQGEGEGSDSIKEVAAIDE